MTDPRPKVERRGSRTETALLQFATGLMRDRGYAQLRRDACVVDKVLPFTSARKRICSFAWTPDDVDVDDDEKIRRVLYTGPHTTAFAW